MRRGVEKLLSVSIFGIAVLVMCQLSAGPLSAGITWTGAVDNNWDASTANWSGDSTVFADDGTVDVTFNSGIGGTITVSPNMSPTSITVSASSGTYTLTAGPIDMGTLSKSGSGSLTMRSAHTFTGRTIVMGGQLNIYTNAYEGVASPLGAPSGANAIIDLHPGTTFLLGSPGGSGNRSTYWTTDRAINLAGTGSGTVRLRNSGNDEWCRFGDITGSGTGPRTLEFYVLGDGGQIDVAGPISDTSDNQVTLLVGFYPQITRTGKLYLSGTNTFSGPLNIITSGGQLPGTVFVSGSGVLGGGTFSNTIAIAHNRILEFASSATQELSGEISGAGSLSLSGTGSLTLSAANSYTGGTSIANGTLNADATGALGTGDVTVASSGLLVMNENNAMSSTATLTLPNDTTQTVFMNQTRCEVDALIINTVAQSNGVYYSSQNAWLGGNGRLFVGVPAPAAGTVIILN